MTPRTSPQESDNYELTIETPVDIAPTILSLAGLQPPQSMQGHDFSKLLNQAQNPSKWQAAVFMENLFLLSQMRARNAPNVDEINEKTIAANKSYRCHGLCTKRFKYFVYYEHNPVIEELYDLEADPHEQNNLVNNPEFATTLKELRKLTEEMYAAAK